MRKVSSSAGGVPSPFTPYVSTVRSAGVNRKRGEVMHGVVAHRGPRGRWSVAKGENAPLMLLSLPPGLTFT